MVHEVVDLYMVHGIVHDVVKVRVVEEVVDVSMLRDVVNVRVVGELYGWAGAFVLDDGGVCVAVRVGMCPCAS